MAKAMGTILGFRPQGFDPRFQGLRFMDCNERGP